MGVYENIRKSKYKSEKGGVYSQIHKDDAPKSQPQTQTKSGYGTSKTKEEQSKQQQAKNIANDLIKSVERRTVKADSLSDYAKQLSPERIQEIKETSAILNPEKYHKDVDAGYYGRKAIEGFGRAGEGIMDAATILNEHLQYPQLKATEFVTSLGGLAKNPVSNLFTERLAQNKEAALKAVQETPVDNYAKMTDFTYNNVGAGHKLAGDVVSGVTAMAPTIATNLLLPGAGYAVLGAQAYGGGTQQAYQHTGELGAKEEIYGLLSGLAEVAVEKVSGGIGGLGNGMVDDIASKMIRNGFIRSATGEGIEEAVTTFIDPYLERLTYNKEAEGGITSAETWKEAVRSALIGTLTSMVLQGGSAAVNTAQTSINTDKDVKKLKKLDNTTLNQLAEIDKNIQQGNVLPRATETQIQQPKQETTTDTELKLPTTKTNSVYQAAKGNVDVKIANRLMDIAERTNARVEGFYNENPDIEGSYKDGVIRINVNSEKAADTIFAHEFTHHLESTNAWEDVRDAIINSNTLYNMLSEQGINIDEYKQQIKDTYAANGVELKTDLDVEKEIVAKFVENNLMKDEKTILRMINENPSFMQRLKNFWDDLVVRFKGTAEEKELRRIQNIYNKAFAEAQKGSTQTTETKYSVGEQANTDNQGRKLSKEQQEFFKDSKVRDENGRLLEVYHGTPNGGFNIYDRSKSGATTNAIDSSLGIYFTDNENLGNIFGSQTSKRDLEEATDEIYEKYNVEFGIVPFNMRAKINEEINELAEKKARGHREVKRQYLNMKKPLSIYGNYGISEQKLANDINYIVTGELKNVQMDDILQPLQKDLQKLAKFKDDLAENPEAINRVKELGYDGIILPTQEIDRMELRNKSQYEGGNEYIVFDSNQIKNIDNLNPTSDPDIRYSINTDNMGRKLSEQQQEFFKDSKVRDEQGNLQVVYHGTADEINVFDKSRLGETTKAASAMEGFFFTSTKTLAEQYSQWSRPKRIVELEKEYKRLKEIAERVRTNEAWDKYYRAYEAYEDAELDYAYDTDNARTNSENQKEVYLNLKNPLIKDFEGQGYRDVSYYDLIIEAKENGKDGAIFLNTYDGWGDHDTSTNPLTNVYVAFESNQIKNVDNTNPTENPDIRYSIETDKQTSTPKRYLSEHANTLLESGVTLPETRDVIAKMVEQGTLTHERITDKDAQTYAEKYIIENGFEDAVEHWNHLIKSNREMSKEELALGQMIYNNAEQARDVNLVKKMIADLVAEGTTAGRNLQAMSMVKRLTPDGRLYALERSVQKLNQQYRDEIGKKFKDIEIPSDLAEALLKSKDQKEIDANVEKIQQYIADQIPATWKDKLNAWRYLAMLGNTRTHIRNLAGNAVFIPAIEIKNAMALVGEKTLPTAERTKAILTKKDIALLDFAENDFANNEQTIRGENKFDIASGVQEKRRIFDNKVLETLRKANFAALEKEDAMFLKYHYKRAMARAIKAKGLSLEQLKSGSAEMNSKLSEIRNYAINEAQKATYRDFNALAKWISNNKSRLKRNAAQSKGYKKAGYELAYAGVEGLIPFTKTPANIVKRIVEYSPVNIAKGIVDMNTSVKNGDMSASQAIDELCSGITGTGIVGLGILLASLGFVTGGGEDKQKEEQFESLKGNQNYALKIGNKTYTIDWAAPSAVPLFVGVEIFNSLKNSENADVMGSFVKIVDPVFEMSMLQGINSALSAYGSDNAIGKAVSNMFQSYLGQYVPSLFGAVARTVDPVRRTTYADKNKMLPTGLQTFTQKQLQKIPVASTTLPTYKDQFGRDSRTDNLLIRIFSNFLSPGYLAEVKDKPVENELTRIYDKTGETDVLPSYASKSITVDGEKINFTYEQYEKFATTRGDIAYKNLEKLFADARYKKLSDEDKVSAIRKIYTYANEVAKSKVSDYKLTKEKARIERQGNNYYKEVLK